MNKKIMPLMFFSGLAIALWNQGMTAIYLSNIAILPSWLVGLGIAAVVIGALGFTYVMIKG